MTFKDLMPWGREKKDLEARKESDYPLSSLPGEMARLVDNFVKGFDKPLWGGLDNFMKGFDRSPGSASSGSFCPQVDITDKDKEILVTAELPGIDEKDIDISLSKDRLTIRGEKKEEKENKGSGFYSMERSFGSFTRDIPLPCTIDTDKVEATYKKGVLTITLPKTPDAISACKKIPVVTE